MPTTCRADPLETGEVYHVMNKSIADFKIFHTANDYLRMKQMMRYFQIRDVLPKFSQFRELKWVQDKGFDDAFLEMTEGSKCHIQILAYCLMPTHVHVIAKQLAKNGISIFMANLLNSYARFFNTKHKRVGPLWVGRFKSVLVKTDEQALHLTRYIHLNPTSAGLVTKPNDWLWSSYQEYIEPEETDHPICQFKDTVNIKPDAYQEFTNDHVDYQRDLAIIKKLALE